MEEKNNSRSSGLDENEIRMNRERRRRQEKENSKDYVVRMLVTQLVVSAVLVGVLFAVSKKGGVAFSFIKDEYQKITSTDMTVQEVWADLKNMTSFVFEEEKTTSVSKEETTESTKPETDEEEEETSLATESGKGGNDIAVFSATSSTLFSPYKISGKICVPVSGEISSLFGYRENPVTGDWSFHTGLDIAASYGENIKSAFYGKVSETGYDDVSGNYVIIDHGNDLVTKYMHCSEIAVEEGTVVRKGETVAYVGSTGRSTGPHLHFVMETDGKAVNPLYAFETDDGKI